MCIAVACSPEQAQVEVQVVDQAEVAAVTAAIQQVFDGMRAHDSSMVRARLVDGTLLHRAGEREGVPTLSSSSVEGWLNSIGQLRDEMLDVQIWD